MPTNGTINYAGNTYSGEVLTDLLVYTAHGNDTYNEGLIHIKPGIQKKFVLPHVKLGKIIQDNKPTPTSTEGAKGADGHNEYTHSERYLEPQDFMVYLEFNPRDFEEYWKPFQPEGELIFRELDPKIQATMLHLLIDRKDQYIGDCIWCSKKGGPDASISSDSADNVVLGGDSEAGPMKYFDGALARVITNLNSTDANEKASGQVILAGNTAMTTGEQVESALYAMYRKCPKNLRKSNKLVYVMGWDLWDAYDQYLTSKDVKYTENADVNRYRFKGKRIVVINGITEQTIFLGKFTTGMDSCLWMGVDYATDQESVKVERLQANSELYFFQMRMKIDVNIVLPSEIVVWTTYKKS
ncbi:hypothetical protein [Bacteroides sp. 224]|uniref:hypothetical protein n=1 Tax=Bacteroides sp. 224 TaxID=2302936 RepID=UPI0013D67D45|nr:hypothetical protein [Bacteroides sp. 224]NDV63953.1 hypothetical protein [Bacteroides sp. 224]